MSISSLGLGPVLSVQVACNVIGGTPQREQAIVATAFWTSFGISLLAAILAATAVLTSPIKQIFGPQFELRSQEIVVGFLILSAVYVLQVSISILEAAQAGLQRQYTTNIVVALGALTTVPFVFMVSKWMPTPIAMLSAGIFPTLILRLFHAFWLMSKRISMMPRWNAFDLSIAKLLLSNGTVYSLAGSAGNFLSHALPTILIGRVMDAVHTGTFAATIHLLNLLSGVTAMLVTPAVPAITSSLAQHDYNWVRNTYIKLSLSALGFSVVAALMLGVVGDQIFQVWLRGTIQPGWKLLVSAGVYFILSTWEVVHFSFILATQKITIASLLIFTRSIVGAILTQIFLPIGGNVTPYIAMSAAVLIVDSVPLYFMVRSRLSKAN